MVKRIIAVIVFFWFSCGISVGQLNVISSNPSFTYLSGTWSYSGNSSITLADGSVSDAGADVYQKHNSSGGVSVNLYLYRKNNYWYCGVHISGGGLGTNGSMAHNLLKYQYYSTSIHPPCWVEWRVLSITNGAPLSSTAVLEITGNTCNSTIPFFSHNVQTNSDNIQFPNLSEGYLNNILPEKGMLTYNVSQNALYVYNGGEWRELFGVKEDINIGTEGKLTLGTLYKISEDRSLLNNLEVNSHTTTDLVVRGVAKFENAVNNAVVTYSSSSPLSLSNLHHTVVLASGSTINTTFNLPSPVLNLGREYVLQNYSPTNARIILAGYPVYTNGSGGTVSSILTGTGMTIFSDGAVWRKKY